MTQPELRGTSMTALHRRWTQAGDVEAREKITVLNLRHSLSTALAALRATGTGHRDPGLNVNEMLASGLGDAFGWMKAPAFRALLEDRAKVLDLQSAADRVVRQTCAATGQHIIDIPPGMTTAERVAWVSARAAKLGITAAARP